MRSGLSTLRLMRWLPLLSLGHCPVLRRDDGLSYGPEDLVKVTIPLPQGKTQQAGRVLKLSTPIFHVHHFSFERILWEWPTARDPF